MGESETEREGERGERRGEERGERGRERESAGKDHTQRVEQHLAASP